MVLKPHVAHLVNVIILKMDIKFFILRNIQRHINFRIQA